MKYFTKISTVEELKKQYFALAKKYHSDINGGSDEIMKAINAEYTELFKVYKDIHQSTKKDAENATYTADKTTNEAPVDFINIISELLKMSGIAVELCGRWLWIGGDTKNHNFYSRASARRDRNILYVCSHRQPSTGRGGLFYQKSL